MKNTIKMKSILRIAGIIAIIAVIGFSMGACNNGSGGGGGGGGSTSTTSGSSGNGSVPATSGQLIVTGLSKYNGQWIGGTGSIGSNAANPLVAYAGFSASGKNGAVNLAQISGGTATLKVWQEKSSTLAGYSGNDTVSFQLMICNKSQIDESVADLGPMAMMDMIVDVDIGNVKMSGGKGTFNFTGMMSF